MKTTLSDDLRARAAELLAAFQSHLAPGRAAVAEEARVRTAAEKLAAEIESIGEPNFDDDRAIERLTKAKIRYGHACRQVEEAIAIQAREAKALVALVRHAVDPCQAILAPAIEHVREVVARELGKHFADPHVAGRIARESDAYRLAYHKTATLPAVGTSLAYSSEPDFSTVAGHCTEILAILEAASDPERALALVTPAPKPARASAVAAR
jgi:hypothetical protein